MQMNKEVSKIIQEFKKDKEISAFIKKHKLSDEDILKIGRASCRERV